VHPAFLVEADADRQGVEEQDVAELARALRLDQNEAQLLELQHVRSPRPERTPARVPTGVRPYLFVVDDDQALAAIVAPQVQEDLRRIAGMLAPGKLLD